MSASQGRTSTWTIGGLVLGTGTMLALAGTSCSDPEVPETPVPDAGPTTTTTAPVVVDAGPTVYTGPCDDAMTQGLQAAIKDREKDELAHGMKMEGSMACAHVAAGGSATARLMLQQGRCYTFIGHAYPNVTELDVEVRLDMGDNPPPILAQFGAVPIITDTDMGTQATVGRKDTCYRWEFMIPAPVRVEAIAKSGAGPVAVQAYSK